MKKKVLAALLVFVFVVTLLPISAFASYSDTGNHWAQTAIEKWSGWGILKGSDDKFRPDAPITRGEMAVIIDRLMDYQTAATNSFTDLGQAFYTDAVLKASAAGVMGGSGNMVRPTADITREEAAVMLGRALGLTESTKASGFTDSSSFSAWAAGYINAMAAKGYIHGADGIFNPKSSITRAETVTILDNAIKGFFNEAKEYTGTVNGTAVINTPGAVLKNMTISGDLIIAEGVANGDVTLTNVTVKGNTIVRGGGANSIHINGASQLGAIIVEKTDAGQIRIVTADGAVVDAVYINDGNDDIILTGSFETVTIASGVKVKAVGAHIDTLNITADDAIFELDSASTVGLLIADAPSTVTNSGTITKAEINADDVILNGNKPLQIVYGSGVLGASDTGGGGYVPPVIAVSSVSVSVETMTLIKGGAAGTITATVSPSNATDKTVTWTSSNPGVATVVNGVVTPLDGGIATITATASGKTATTTVTVGDTLVTAPEKIQAAIDTAASDDILIVAPGAYSEDLTISKPISLISQDALAARITGSITIGNNTNVTSNVSVDGFKVNAKETYDSLPVIHIINAVNVNILNNRVYVTAGTYQLSIGTSTGPARVTGTISGNTVSGAIGLGTEGKLSVTNNIVTYATHEGIWFYPVGTGAALTITGNDILSFGTAAPGLSAIKVETRPASINGVADELAMAKAISDANGSASVKLSWITTVNNAAGLTAAISSAKAGDIILISGTIGSTDAYTAYEITKPITIKGLSSASKVYGSFIIKTDGVTVDGLTLYTRGGGNGPLKTAIDVIAKQATITNNIFELPNPAALAANGGVGNGVTIWPVGTADANYMISGNHFIGYKADTSSWSSSALQIAEGLELSRFSMPGVTSLAVDLNGALEAAMAAGNTYTDCTNNYVHSNWSSGIVYKFVYASTIDQFTGGMEYAGDNSTILLAAGTYELPTQLQILKPLTLQGVGPVIFKPAGDFNEGTYNADKHLISINSVSGLVKLDNLTVQNSKRAGINVFESSNVLLSNIISIDNTGAGLVVCSSVVTAENFNTSGNGWGYGINVDNGSNPSADAPIATLTLSSGTISEAKQIVSDKGGVVITAPNYAIYINDAAIVHNANITSWYGTNNEYLDTSVNFNFEKLNVASIDSVKFYLYQDDTLLGTRYSTGANLVTLLKDCAQYWDKTAETYLEVTGDRIMSAAFMNRDAESDNGYWVSSACTASYPSIPNHLVVEVVVDNVTYIAIMYQY